MGFSFLSQIVFIVVVVVVFVAVVVSFVIVFVGRRNKHRKNRRRGFVAVLNIFP
jgi:hypothetical protein